VSPKLKDNLNSDDKELAYKFRALAEGDTQIGEMIRTAKKLEGSVRNTGIHACGVVITPDDITNYVPVTVAKDSDLLVSQFDNSVAEDAGTIGVFQYESPGMQKHLQGLKPSVFADLIAMNALYRPGPLQYIPDFILPKVKRICSVKPWVRRRKS